MTTKVSFFKVFVVIVFSDVVYRLIKKLWVNRKNII